jgi:hypothetical protein
MGIAPLQPHGSWYRRFWYADRSPLDTLLDRALIFAVTVMALLASVTLLIRQDVDARAGTRATLIQATR